jgi:mannan endo-1,4-beta-mannosidase
MFNGDGDLEEPPERLAHWRLRMPKASLLFPIVFSAMVLGCGSSAPGSDGPGSSSAGGAASSGGSCATPCGADQICQGGVCTTVTTSSGQTGTGGATSTGSGGTTAGGPGAPAGLAGVVVSIDDMGTLGCVPLCRNAEHPDDTDLSDDWAYEGFSCVLPNSSTGTRNQSCTTGEALPAIDRDGLPGVVVDNGGDGVLDCVPLCEPGAQPSGPDATNPSSYDWGWEFQASCIIRDTDTANCNQACTTGQLLPSPALIERPGVLIDEVCTALCTCESMGDDPNWGWEFQTQCVVQGSAPALDRLACTTNDAQTFVPPALAGTKLAPGFYTDGSRLYDAYGNDFVMRGVNNPHIWFDIGNQYLAYRALDAIAGYGANTVRVVWETTGTASMLARILFRIVELEMVPMVELHDVTGSSANADLLNVARYYTQADVLAVLQDFREYALINIANEWSGEDFQGAYASAIAELRAAGLTHTLVIDANGFGQNVDAIFANASPLLAGDPESNLLFSLHMYSRYGDVASVNAALDQAASQGIPLVVGEFGHQLQGQPVAWQQVLAKCQEHGIGYLAWSWSGNDADTAQLNIVNDFGGALTPQWGQPVMVGDANSIQNTSVLAGIFQ